MQVKQDQPEPKNYLRSIRGSKEDGLAYVWPHNLTKGKKPVMTIARNVTVKKLLDKRLVEERNRSQQQMKEAVITAQEMERSAIGIELHDNVNQILGAARMYIMTAMKETVLHKENLLELASTYVLNSIDEIRKLSKTLVKPALQSGGLMQAINKLVEDLMIVSPASIRARITDVDENDLDELFKLNVFRIIQEQLNNINKHAFAKNISIHLSKIDHEIRMLIVDDGKGFDSATQHAGIGLYNIRNRAKLFGGQVEIISSPGNGCRLHITFPYSETIMKN